MKSILAICVFVSLSCVYANDIPECKKHECMEYEVLKTTDKYEVRRYKPYKLASVTTKGMPWVISDFMNFRRLFSFIQGDNSKKLKIPMTIPVLNFYKMKENGKINTWMSQMTFVMPEALTSSVPEPTNKNIKIVDFGPVTVYAFRFGGWMTSQKIFQYKQELSDALKADGVSFDESTVGTAGYNSPMEWTNRHNDIFYMAKENASVNY